MGMTIEEIMADQLKTITEGLDVAQNVNFVAPSTPTTKLYEELVEVCGRALFEYDNENKVSYSTLQRLRDVMQKIKDCNS